MKLILGSLEETLEVADCGGVQLALLDPPYFMGNKPFDNEELSYSRVVESWDNQWDSLEDYYVWNLQWVSNLYDRMEKGGAVLVFQSFHGLTAMKRALDDSMFSFRNLITWFIPNAPPIKWAKKMGVYAHSCQFILYYSKGVPAFFDYDLMKRKNGGAQHRDLIVHNRATHAERLGHPTQKPLSLIQLLVQAHCPPKGTVLDFFSGSGTTAEAAFLIDRDFVCGDRVPEYHTMAVDRLRRYENDVLYGHRIKELEVSDG